MRHVLSTCVLAAAFGLLSSNPSLAQSDVTFTVNQGQSSFTWSGTSSLGPIVGNPSNTFALAGTVGMHVAPVGAQSIGSASFVPTGDTFTVPDLHGKVPNPISFLPPLATIDVTNMHLTVSSSPFAVAGGGAWDANPVLTVLSGTLTVAPLVGTTTITDLAGFASAPTPSSGTLEHLAGNLRLVAPINAAFPFDDPASGTSGSITLVGNLVGNWVCPVPTTYCTAKVNSLGCTPDIGSVGMPSYSSAAPFTIEAASILNGRSGILFYGYGQQATPFQGGTMCVMAPVKRTPVQDSGGSLVGNDCTGHFSFEMNARIQSGVDGSLVPGAEAFAQYWSRDPQSPGTTNLTNAIAFTVCP